MEDVGIAIHLPAWEIARCWFKVWAEDIWVSVAFAGGRGGAPSLVYTMVSPGMVTLVGLSSLEGAYSRKFL